jgi:hypothetical protein
MPKTGIVISRRLLLLYAKDWYSHIEKILIIKIVVVISRRLWLLYADDCCCYIERIFIVKIVVLYREDCYCCIEKIFVVISRTSLKVRLGMLCEGVMSQKERLPTVTGISSDLKIWWIRAGGGFGDLGDCIKQKIKYKARLEKRMDFRWHSIVGFECLVRWAPGIVPSPRGDTICRRDLVFCATSCFRPQIAENTD